MTKPTKINRVALGITVVGYIRYSTSINELNYPIITSTQWSWS